ncbi:pentapeptide repeat-containing protein [Flavobacterium psychrophilum]|uniref:pentapeptide repeat-containing protein n=1 Tax=Flavobacterium psychrophilum TaxID=96345 RepID=UPI000B7C520A|nr:pentapeptide repeat-containing protein [Flavobacterium psychrophilum]MCB6089540.1 pentapeptide repeat-containing protein [Flavobacterium psychrophilum]MCB6232146.1 pentapeptide repeat-containing protein [Flavobacterium psychrophilum]MEB3380635.1 pentapeptide repeat-containing protein [Flavobacterium psychrophilum]SNA82237.1 hypothetical protein DK095_520004 [Flavobacterium psychrophilum]SNA88061.1 hypothetical protein FI146_790001 [Flavobacterium psychrophilum]
MRKKVKITQIIYFLLFCLFIFLIISRQWEIKIGFENFAQWLYPKNEDRNAELLKIFLSIIGGLGILYTLYLGYKKAKAADKGLILQSEAINKQSEQLELSRKAQVDERFKNAIEHLGSDKEPIILGGLVELHQIAKEDKNKYAAVVFNILTSFLRSTLKVDIPRENNFSNTIPQTIIDFLFRGDDLYLYNKYKANLSHCNFKSIDINNCQFIESDFSFSLMPMIINDVNFEKSKLSRADFTIGRISNTIFTNTELHDNLFNFCEFKNVDFSNSKMYTQLFINAKMFDCTFFNANLYNSNFLLSHFEDTFFSRADILSLNFLGCNFINSDFSENKTLSKTNFSASGFAETTFGSKCFDCNFSGARPRYQFDFIQLKDVEENIDKNTNKIGIIEIGENRFFNCNWNNLTKNDFDKISNECFSAVKLWREKYKSNNEQKKTKVTLKK